MSSLQPDRRALAWMLATALAAVVPLAGRLPWWVLGVGGAAGLWRLLGEARGWRHPGQLLRWTLTAAAAFAVYREFGQLFGRDPGLALLVVLLGLKFLELRTLRDCILSVLLCFVVLAGGYLYGQALWLGPYTLLVVLLGAVTLLRLAQPHGLTERARLRLAGVMLLQALPLALAGYLLFPRMQGALWALPQDAHAGRTGLSDEMRPGSINELGESEQVAFRASFAGAPPAPGELYWRALVLWDTDGARWTRGVPLGVAEPGSALGPAVRYTITLEPSNKPWLPLLDVPRTLPPLARWGDAHTAVRAAAASERLVYSAESVTRQRSAALGARERARALALPSTVSARVRALADGWRARHGQPAAIAQAALEHFRREAFVYTLRPPLLGADPVDEFLFETRRGYCEHFAAAFVTLMRAAAVPARVVLGYQGGELNAAGNYYIVQQADAHAWAEIWLPDSGWQRVDPTAAVAPERIELGSFALRRLSERGLQPGALPGEALARVLALSGLERAARAARHYWDLANLGWYRWVAGYDQTLQGNLLRAIGFAQASARELAVLLAASAAGLLLLYALWLARAHAARDPVQALYARYCRKLARFGLVRGAHEGPLDFARRCRARMPHAAAGIERVTDLYVRLRYADNASRETLRALRRAVAALPRR